MGMEMGREETEWILKYEQKCICWREVWQGRGEESGGLGGEPEARWPRGEEGDRMKSRARMSGALGGELGLAERETKALLGKVMGKR